MNLHFTIFALIHAGVRIGDNLWIIIIIDNGVDQIAIPSVAVTTQYT